MSLADAPSTVLRRGPFIDGQWLSSEAEASGVVERLNPADTSELVGTWLQASAEQVDQAVAAATAFAPEWAATALLARGRILVRAAEIMLERTEELARLLSREEGKTVAEARGEVFRTAETIRFHGLQAWQPVGEVFSGENPTDLIRTHRVPVGVVAAITPWNFPLNTPAWKIAPALVWGCPVIWKPASFSALTSAAMVDCFVDAGLPPRALQLVPGPGVRGQQLAEHPDVKAVTFTGSERIGFLLQKIAAENNKPIQAELGGHNPAIVFADADLDLAVSALVTGFTSGTGQKCTGTRRILVHTSVKDRLVEKLVAALGALRVGNGADPAVQMGPIVDAGAREEIVAAIDKALADGVTLLTGGSSVPPELSGGHFVLPTLFETDDPRVEIAQEEVFGPVSTVLPFEDDEEAFALANATRFGLSATVFTSNEVRARRAADVIHAGMININKSTTGSELHVPFGGLGTSSTPGPKEQGHVARDFFTELKAVYSTATFRPDPRA